MYKNTIVFYGFVKNKGEIIYIEIERKKCNENKGVVL